MKVKSVVDNQEYEVNTKLTILPRQVFRVYFVDIYHNRWWSISTQKSVEVRANRLLDAINYVTTLEEEEGGYIEIVSISQYDVKDGCWKMLYMESFDPTIRECIQVSDITTSNKESVEYPDGDNFS